MNKYVKMLGCVLSVLLLVGLLAACGGGDQQTTSENNSNDSENTEAPAEESKKPSYTFRLAETHAPDYPTTLGDIKFAELVKEKSDGRIQIDVFPSAQLGEEKAVVEQVQLGAIEFTRVSSGILAGFNKDFGVFSLPYIFESQEHMWNYLNGENGQSLLSSLEDSKMKGLAYMDPGSRSFYTKELVTGLEDLKGKKIRVIQNEVNVEIMDALGINATPMAYGEVYSSLQTGVIDGAENNYPSYYSSKHYEVAPYYLVDRHQRVPEVLLVSTVTWNKLDEEDRAIIQEAAQEAIDYQINEWNRYEKESEEKVREAGSTITEVDDIKPWQEAVEPVIEKYRADYGEVLDAIEAAK
ncbi:TRAP transporter substrate-binding protein [Halalkalibacter urbisdiaboli]|uniref:TRAP transporter substrate-binding protein n=1 Tax=Halalkalibacter urbisdiaboli TaxID=1960589 RepID=UPI000B42D2EF|nr:TRAP transporter substrate-binding protein [Halalkalibacter urbisdiaboli]